MFLAEGSYDPGVLPAISDATFTVFSNSTGSRSQFSTSLIVPEPITPSLLTPEYLQSLVPPPPPPQPETPAPPHQPPPANPQPDPPPSVEPPEQPLSDPAPPVVVQEPQTEPDPQWPVIQVPTIWLPPTGGEYIDIENTGYGAGWIINFYSSDPDGQWHLPGETLRERQVAMIAKLRELAVQTNAAVDPLAVATFIADPSAYFLQSDAAAEDSSLSVVTNFASFSGTSASATIKTSDSIPTPEPSALALLIVAQGFCLVATRPRRAL
jgi:hypothetical protein